MRVVGAVACFLVALDGSEKALGTAPQHLFSDQNIWLWWFAVAGWSVGTLRFALGK